MIRPATRQTCRTWQVLVWSMALVIAGQGCATIVDPSAVPSNERSAAVGSPPTSIAKHEPRSETRVGRVSSKTDQAPVDRTAASAPTNPAPQRITRVVRDPNVAPAKGEAEEFLRPLAISDDAIPREQSPPNSSHWKASMQTSSAHTARSTSPRRIEATTLAQNEAATADEFQPPLVPQGPTLPRKPIHIPLEGDDLAKDIKVTLKNGRVSLVTRNAPVQSVLNLLAEQQGVNLITSDEVTANVSVSLSDVSFEDALSSIVAIAGCNWTEQNGIILVTKSGTGTGSPAVTGKVVQVFPLNYVAAADIEATVKGLLSPMGQIFSTQMSPTDKRRTQEHLVVEDIPPSVARVAELISQLDQPPRQVLIQAHILQVELKDDTRHGINWENIIRVAGGDLALKTVGFANPLASPAALLSFDGEHLDVLVEALKQTSDTKTLASPKVIVANGQEARVQIGQRLGYFVTTTTQTSTLQNVNFLDTGVVMRVTPQISDDNRVLMTVRPEVSSGRISALGLPETQTTEANTTVLVDDGGGIVIGGLIKESDVESQDKVPLLGDVWLLGRAFQRRTTSRVRSEIVIVLIPRIAPYGPDYCPVEQFEVAKAQVPLLHGALEREDRPWEPRLPDAIRNPRRFRPHRLKDLATNPAHSDPKPLKHYFPTADEEAAPEATTSGWAHPTANTSPAQNHAERTVQSGDQGSVRTIKK